MGIRDQLVMINESAQRTYINFTLLTYFFYKDNESENESEPRAIQQDVSTLNKMVCSN